MWYNSNCDMNGKDIITEPTKQNDRLIIDRNIDRQAMTGGYEDEQMQTIV